MDDTVQINELLSRYYRAHAAEDPELIGHEAFAEPLLQRILVDELGGDTFEQAFLEANLLSPEDAYERAAELAEAEYDVEVSGDTATAYVRSHWSSLQSHARGGLLEDRRVRRERMTPTALACRR